MGMLSGKVAIVTGASSGIGYAAATLFAREGGRVVAAAPRQGELDGLLEGIVQQGGVALALVGDVRDEDYAQALVDMAVARFGGLDVAFNNAGTIGSVGGGAEYVYRGMETYVR